MKTVSRPILYACRNGIGRLTLNRPEVRNALDRGAWKALGRLADRIRTQGLRGRRGARCIVVAGRGKGFCAGTDVRDLAGVTKEAARALARLENDVLCRLEDLPVPTIAAVHGFALGGGCELAMACDLRVAAEGAVFGQPEVDLGWMPAAGGTFRLPRLVGVGRAKEMIYTGCRIDAAEALRIGLVNRVVAEEKVVEEALLMARAIASKDPAVLRAAKHALTPSMDREQAIGREAAALAKLATSTEAQNRIRRF